MSQWHQEILAAAWPDHPIRTRQWDGQAHAWQDDTPWNLNDPRFHPDGILGDPLPLVAVETDAGRWVVPATDGMVWWWASQNEFPECLPVVVAD